MDYRYREVILEVDSQVVKDLLTCRISTSNYFGSVVDRCKLLLSRGWSVEIIHLYREVNKVADWLANLALKKPIGEHILNIPPTDLCRFYKRTCEESLFPVGLFDALATNNL